MISGWDLITSVKASRVMQTADGSQNNFRYMIKKKAPLVLMVVFFFSGFSSLIYQTAWQRILTLYYSVENISTTLIVSVYMMGLGLGALLGGYVTERLKNKLTFYIFVELLIGLFGLISIPLLEIIGKNTSGNNYLVSFAGMFLFLCIPTILMGITLPLLTRIYNAHVKNFFNTLSYLYFINTLGAAFGCLFTSYVLITFFGLDTGVYVAATLNLAIAATVWLYSKKKIISSETSLSANTDLVEKQAVVNAFRNPRVIYMIVFITGFIAVGYEIIWFRVIGTIVKASPYAFTSVLFTYLMGIAVGSFIIKQYLKTYINANRKNLFFLFQFLIAFYVLGSIIAYNFLIQNVSIVSAFNDRSFANMEHPLANLPQTDSIAHFLKDLFKLFDVFIWPLVFIFIPTLFMGASFPLITSLAFRKNQTADTVGKVYFFNVLGNVTGGLITGLFFLEAFGSERSMLVLSVAGLLFILFATGRQFLKTGYKVAALIIIVGISIQFFPTRHELFKSIHPKNEYHPSERKIFTEGIDGVIATYSHDEKLRTYINGMSHGGRPLPMFYFEAIEALSYKSNPDSVLIVGFGTGSTVETILKAPSRPKIKLVELSETLVKNLTQIDYLRTYLQHPQVDVEFADGRKFLQNSKQKFDAIFMDPLRTTTSFSNNLYSQEFFTLVKEHMNYGGVFMLWTDEHNIVPKTLCTVFPFVKKYSFFCIASLQDLQPDSTIKYAMFEKFADEYKRDLYRIDSNEKQPLTRARILKQTEGYPVNKDYKPRSEYYIGLKRYK